MPRIKYIGDAEDVAIPGGPLWAVGQERELPDEEAARYRRSNVFTVDDAAPVPEPTVLAPDTASADSPAGDPAATNEVMT